MLNTANPAEPVSSERIAASSADVVNAAPPPPPPKAAIKSLSLFISQQNTE